jgi:immune inhibitor A
MGVRQAHPRTPRRQTLTVAYSVNGGASWTTLEAVTGESPWTGKSFSLSPSADNKTALKIRFTLVGDNATNRAFIDNVTVTGVSP